MTVDLAEPHEAAVLAGSGPAPQGASGRRRPALARSALALVVVTALGLLLWGSYLASLHAAAGNSDGATVILEGQAMAGGNVVLRHWTLSYHSFWLVDALVSALAVAVAGVRPQLLHLVPALVAVGLVVTGALLVGRGRQRFAGLLAGGAVVVLLGLPDHVLSQFLLMGPLHVTTTLWCLWGAICLRRGTFSGRWLLGVVLLAAGMLGDLQTLAIGALPVLLAGAAEGLRTRRMRAFAPTGAALVASVVLAVVVRQLTVLLGAFSIGPANPLAASHQMAENLRHLAGYIAGLAGAAQHPLGAAAVPLPLVAAHLVGLVLAGLGAAFALVRLFLELVSKGGRPGPGRGESSPSYERFMRDYLLFALFGSCGLFVALATSSSTAYCRYLTPALVFGSLLAGLLVGHVAEAFSSLGWRVLLAAGLIAVAAGYGGAFANALRGEAPVQPSARLADYLVSHHLRRGLGAYWSASIVTVESSQAVVVRPVITLPGTDHIVRYMKQSSADWYRGGFQFLVYDAAALWGGVGPNSAAVTFGRPSGVVSVGPYRVLVWSRPISVRPDGRFAPARRRAP